MYNFFKWTAWEMTPPTSYGLFHLLYLFIGGFIAVAVAWLLRKTNDKQNRIVLLAVGLFLIVTELYKQLFYYFIVNDYHYPLWIFPFQLCSVPMYLCIFCACCKSEKVNSWLYNFMFAFNLLGGAISFAEPSGLNHPYWTLTLHAYTWHMTLVFLGLYLFFSKRAGTNAKDYLKALIVFIGCAAIAQIFNLTLINIEYINMFYISPFVKSPIVVFTTIWETCGWFVNMLLFLFALILGAAIIYYIGYLCRYLKSRRKSNSKTNS